MSAREHADILTLMRNVSDGDITFPEVVDRWVSHAGPRTHTPTGAHSTRQIHARSGMASTVRLAQEAFRSERVIASRDFMTFPVPRPDQSA